MRLRFTVAGHPAPILVREGSPPKRLDVTGFAIGMFDEAEYEESVIDLQSWRSLVSLFRRPDRGGERPG